MYVYDFLKMKSVDRSLHFVFKFHLVYLFLFIFFSFPLFLPPSLFILSPLLCWSFVSLHFSSPFYTSLFFLPSSSLFLFFYRSPSFSSFLLLLPLFLIKDGVEPYNFMLLMNLVLNIVVFP